MASTTMRIHIIMRLPSIILRLGQLSGVVPLVICEPFVLFLAASERKAMSARLEGHEGKVHEGTARESRACSA
jgi:hypothetical protein